jgi:hypothetical protein
MKTKLKHTPLIIIQCLLVSFTLYMFRELFIITLPVWLITMPVWLPLIIYYLLRIGINYYRKKNPKPLKEDATIQDKYENLLHRYYILESENKSLKSSHTEVLKNDKEINLDGLKWMWSKPPELLKQTTHFEIATSHGYDNCRRMETYSNLEDAILNAKQKYNLENHPKMSEENFKYWNTKDEIITKVTTVKEIMAVIRAEEKI